MYTIEYNISDLKTKIVHNIESIAENNGFEHFHHGWDRLVLKSNRGLNFTKLIDEIANMCSAYGVEYLSLLDLES